MGYSRPGWIIEETGGRSCLVPSVGPSPTRVLMSILAQHYAGERAGGGACLVRIQEDTGMSRSTIFACLDALKAEGLIVWDEHKRGTIRPLSEVVRMG